MVIEASKNNSQRISNHHVKANEVVGSVISILETSDAIIKHNFQC
jgi:hypothetical protein